jgi:hypothetical protein
MKEIYERRVRVPGEPSAHRLRQSLYLFLCHRGQAAPKPLARDGEANGLHSPQRRIMRFAPHTPELDIAVVLQKIRNLVNVRRPRIPAQQVT